MLSTLRRWFARHPVPDPVTVSTLIALPIDEHAPVYERLVAERLGVAR